MNESTHAGDIDRLLAGAREVIAAARRPDELADVPAASAVTVEQGRGGTPQLRIDADWERRLPAADLGPAVSGAIATFLRSQQSVPMPEEELPAWQPDLSGRNLNAAMARINAALDASYGHLAEAQAQLDGTALDTVASERGQVSAQVVDGRIATVTIDPAWASGKSGPTIATEVSGVLADAGTVPAPAPVDPLAADPRAAYDYLRETL